MSSSIESWVSGLQIQQPLENSPHTASYYANALITSFLEKLPTKSWLGKRLVDCARLDQSDRATINLANNIWRALTISDRIRSEVQGANPNDTYVIKCGLTKHWNTATSILETSMKLLFENNPAASRATTMGARTHIKLCMLLALRDVRCVARWNALIHAIQLDEQSLIDEGLIRPAALTITPPQSPAGL
nr:hypothetical protein [Plasmopara viticola lesion associated mononegaambi virus 9]